MTDSQVLPRPNWAITPDELFGAVDSSNTLDVDRYKRICALRKNTETPEDCIAWSAAVVSWGNRFIQGGAHPPPIASPYVFVYNSLSEARIRVDCFRAESPIALFRAAALLTRRAVDIRAKGGSWKQAVGDLDICQGAMRYLADICIPNLPKPSTEVTTAPEFSVSICNFFANAAVADMYCTAADAFLDDKSKGASMTSRTGKTYSRVDLIGGVVAVAQRYVTAGTPPASMPVPKRLLNFIDQVTVRISVAHARIVQERGIDHIHKAMYALELSDGAADALSSDPTGRYTALCDARERIWHDLDGLNINHNSRHDPVPPDPFVENPIFDSSMLTAETFSDKYITK